MLWIEHTRAIIPYSSSPSCAEEHRTGDWMEVRALRPRMDTADRLGTQALPQVQEPILEPAPKETGSAKVRPHTKRLFSST
jgi:hypothetical protein